MKNYLCSYKNFLYCFIKKFFALFYKKTFYIFIKIFVSTYYKNGRFKIKRFKFIIRGIKI